MKENELTLHHHMNYQNFCTLISLKKSANYPWKSNGTLAIFQKISPEIPAEIVDFFCVGILGKLVLYYKKEEGCSLEILKKNWLCLWVRHLWSSENCIVGVASRSGRINQWQCSIPCLAIGCFFRFCFQLRQPSFHWIIGDGVVTGIGRNGNVLILPTPIPSSLWLRLRLRFSLGLSLERQNASYRNALANIVVPSRITISSSSPLLCLHILTNLATPLTIFFELRWSSFTTRVTPYEKHVRHIL